MRLRTGVILENNQKQYFKYYYTMKIIIIISVFLLILFVSGLSAGDLPTTEVQNEQLKNAVLTLIESVRGKDDKRLVSLLQELDSRTAPAHRPTVSRVHRYLKDMKDTDVKFGSTFQQQEKNLIGIRIIEPICLDFTFIRIDRKGKEVLLLQAINP